jgi:uncharacterized membrane protein YadS
VADVLASVKAASIWWTLDHLSARSRKLSVARVVADQRRIRPLLVLGVIGYAGKFTEQAIAAYGKAHHLTLPNIEYVLWAIVFGLIVSNTVGGPSVCDAGIDTYEFWLKTGIVLLGVRFVLGDVAKLGGVSLACVFIELVVPIAIMTALDRRFRLPPKLISLLSIGASVCGVSAIIAARGAIDADDEMIGSTAVLNDITSTAVFSDRCLAIVWRT